MGEARDIAKDAAYALGLGGVKELINHYKDEGNSLRDTAKKIGVTHQILNIWCKEYKIKFPRSPAKHKAEIQMKKLGFKDFISYFSARVDMNTAEMGKELDVSQATIIRIYNEQRKKLEGK